MTNRTLLGVSVVGACVLIGSAFSGAWASSPRPLRDLARSASAQDTTFNNRVTINNVLRVRKNASVYGHMYAHKGLQVWDGLLVHGGGIKADSLELTGPIQVQSATVAGVLQAGAMSGTTLSLTGNETLGGGLTVSGKISGNGVDGGSGGVTTTGNISGAGISGSSATISGAVNAQTSTVNNLTVTGTANFNGATVSGLSANNLILNGATLTTLNIGAPSSTTPPLNVSENGHTTQLGVTSSGALTTGDLALSGNLSVAGTSGVTAPLLSAPVPSGGTTAGALALQGSTITLNGATTLGSGNDLSLTSGNGTASHLLGSSDRDFAGQVTIQVSSGQTTSTASTATVTFLKPFSSPPIITVTPAQDPNPDGAAPPKVWVSVQQGSNSSYTGFTLHYVPASTASTGRNIAFNYVVVG